MGVKFDKDEFKKSVADNLKVLYRKTVDEADKQQILSSELFCQGHHNGQMACNPEDIREGRCQNCSVYVNGVPYGPCPWQ